MSGRELSRISTSEKDSNIPVLRKAFPGAKKPKNCSKLPELQRYIETIIKGSNELEPENASFSKGRHAISKGPEKAKFDVISNKRKNRRETSKKYSEAVSRGVEVLHKFFSEFEDPRNWKIRNSDSHLRLEKLIEKFYPNPYTIRFQNDKCRTSETQIFLQKVNKDYLGDETFYDVFISKLDAETQDNIDLVSADFQIILTEREDNASLAVSFESLNRSQPVKVTNQDSKCCLKPIKNPSGVRYSHSVSNVNARVTSVENINRVINKESQVNIRRNIFSKKHTAKREVFKKTDLNDYDLGKLKLLNLSGSESSMKSSDNRRETTSNIVTDDFVNEISSEICNEISKTNDLNDLLQIYEVMNKATESFLYLTSMKSQGLENGKTGDGSEDTGVENRTLEDISEEEKMESEKLENIEEEPVTSGNEVEEHGDAFDANQKIQEVLQFMNDCITKFDTANSSHGNKNDEEKDTEEEKTPTNNEESSSQKTSKNQNARIRCKRKSTQSSIETENPSASTNIPSTSSTNSQPEPNVESVLNNEEPQVAEVQNELGGYAEEPQSPNTNTSRVVKTVFPLSTKVRRTQPETYKTLKDALETEEKLLKLSNPKNTESQIYINTEPMDSMGGCGGFNPGFIFYITPFSPVVSTTNIPIPKPLSLSLIDFRSWSLKSLPPIKEDRVEKLFIPSLTEHRAFNHMYSFKIELLSTLSKKKVVHYASLVCFPSVIGFPKLQKETPKSYSRRQIRVKPLKKYSIVNLNTPRTTGLCIRNTVAFATNKSDLLTESLTKLADKPVEALLKAIKETESVFLLKQQNDSKNSSCGSKEVNAEGVYDEQEKETDKRKVQDLLLRTYRLQKKLQQYLCNINQPVSRGFEKGLQVIAENTPSVDKKSSKPEIDMVDRGTTYVPPVEEEARPNSKNKEEENDDDDDDDDRSSTYSFKSSNDFSETNELFQEPSHHVTEGEVIKRIFSQIELLKHNVDPENLEKEGEDNNDGKLVKMDSKNPAKVLKTVFKGRKSSTELTIGLKDVPMTKVRNISVEKTKFSPNHTKISICISKENGLGQTHGNALSEKVSSYFLDGVRPSLSMCRTEYSKSSETLNERTEDEDDDFKSVCSNIADSDSSANSKPETKKSSPQPMVRIPPVKSFNKHRFDFYRKMDMNVEGVRLRPKPPPTTLGRIKELEPLKQALTELQIRMRSIKRDAILNSNDYYERALRLAKMSAGYCQSCGTRAVIPDDTFGYYKTLLPRRTAQRRSRHFKTTIAPNSSFYSFQSSNAEVSGQFCDLDITGSSSFSLNRTTHSNRTVLKSLLQDMPILYEKL